MTKKISVEVSLTKENWDVITTCYRECKPEIHKDFCALLDDIQHQIDHQLLNPEEQN